MQSLAERFYEIGEPYAGGLFEQPDRSPFFSLCPRTAHVLGASANAGVFGRKTLSGRKEVPESACCRA